MPRVSVFSDLDTWLIRLPCRCCYPSARLLSIVHLPTISQNSVPYPSSVTKSSLFSFMISGLLEARRPRFAIILGASHDVTRQASTRRLATAARAEGGEIPEDCTFLNLTSIERAWGSVDTT